MLSNIDFRDDATIRAGIHAIAHIGRHQLLVRGIDRFTHLPTRDRAAMVWVQRPPASPTMHGLYAVALDDIEIRTGGQS